MGKAFGGRGGLRGLGDIAGMMKQAQKMQEDMLAAQEELLAARVEGTAGGGAVKAVVDGKGKIVSIAILPDAVDPDDVEMLQDLVVGALREAEEKAEALEMEKMQGVTGGLGLPPGMF